MAELTGLLLGYPTVIFTVVLGVSVIYWLFVVLGALDLDFLGGGDAAADGALEGAVKGVAEGAIKGIAEGAVKGVTEGLTEGGAEGTGEGHLAAFFSALNLHKAPVTVVLTLFAAFGWLSSALTMRALERVVPLPSWLVGTGVLLVSSFASLLATSVAIRPLGRLFVTHKAKEHRDLVGQTCVVSTGRVDVGFGQATVDDGGAGLILQVRCDTTGALRRGDRALIIGWDDAANGFMVEPLEPVLAGERVGPGADRALVDASYGTEGEELPSDSATTNRSENT